LTNRGAVEKAMKKREAAGGEKPLSFYVNGRVG
jgi:hypothetical protein